MKKILSLLLLLMASSSVFAQETTLFDSNGDPCAYIDMNDADNTVYLWNGTPVCYLEGRGSYYNVYGFNGVHLGWYEDGKMANHSGYVVGFKKGAISHNTKYEGYKPLKKAKPYKSARQYEPGKPYIGSLFASGSLTSFLKNGLGD